MQKNTRRKRNRLEILTYVHFNPLYRALRRSARRVSRLRLAVIG
ncbi:MAG: hypothetical protein MOGMAGMI_01259 [Candidatus Omnitrophica bacterium]|nr:hypothetical protein [Candidatus Omnitrophota bacterium]